MTVVKEKTLDCRYLENGKNCRGSCIKKKGGVEKEDEMRSRSIRMRREEEEEEDERRRREK